MSYLFRPEGGLYSGGRGLMSYTRSRSHSYFLHCFKTLDEF